MATPAITQWDAQAKPIQSGPTQWDADGTPITANTPPPSSGIQPDPADVWKAGVHSQMLGVDPGYAYQNRDNIDQVLRQRGGNYDDTIGHAAETGFEETPLGMILRHQAPEPFESPSILNDFVHD